MPHAYYLMIMSIPDLPLALDLLVAALVGLAVGVEREWSGHAHGPDGRFAGARTFALLGGIGGFAGWFFRLGQPALGAVAIGAALLMPIAAYAMSQRRDGSTADGTTEVAALLVVLMGVTAGLGFRTPASAAAAITVVLLAEKSALQQVLQRVAPTEMRAAVQFAVLALVILPVLPDGPMGPFNAFRPRQLWTVVLLFSGLNFVGYIARRIIGETRGLGVTGLLGGLVSSTAVSFTFSRRSRVEPEMSAPLALGVVAACTVLLPRIIVITELLQPEVAMASIPVLLPSFIAGLTVIGVAIWRERDTRPAEQPDSTANAHATTANGGSPLGLSSALIMAVGFQLVLFAIAWVQQHHGSTGVLTSAALLGLTDMDALTLSMARYGTDSALVRTAAAAIGIGVLSNTALKFTVVAVLGDPRFRLRAGAGLLLLAVGSAIGLALRWP